MCSYLVMDCFGTLLLNGRGVLDSKYFIGLGSYDITGLAVDVFIFIFIFETDQLLMLIRWDTLIQNRSHLGFTLRSKLAHLLLQGRKGSR